MWSSNPNQCWSNQLLICGSCVRLPYAAMYHGILLHQRLPESKGTRHSPFEDAIIEYQQRKFAVPTTSSSRDRFYEAHSFYCLLVTLLRVHDVLERSSSEKPKRIRSRPGTSFLLVCFPKQLH